MSTRAMYTFQDERTTVHVYKHFDGYPSGAHEFITNAMPYAWDLPRFEADDFAAAFVAANKTQGGGNVRLCGTAIQEPWQFSSDSEYWYVITCPNGELHIEAFEVNWWGDEPESTRIFEGTLEEMAKFVEEQE